MGGNIQSHSALNLAIEQSLLGEDASMANDGSPRDPGLQLLIDKQEIHETLMRYCHGVDRGDLELILSAFHADASDNHTGADEHAIDRFTRTVEQGRTMITSHNLSNVLIQVDGDVAHSQAYFVAWHRFDHEGAKVDWLLSGRYLDRHERRRGQWRIAHRTVVYDCERFDEVGPKPMGHPTASLLEHGLRGARSRADASYQVLRF
jgi:hypothetical protein